MAPLTILSYNVRGLNSRGKRLRTKLFLESRHRSPDILCIQEHKLRAGSLSRLEFEIWNTASWTSSPAADGIHASRNQLVNGGLGGLAIAIGQRMVPYVSDRGILPSGQAVWVHFENDRVGKLGFVGIYAPNSSRERCALWQELFVSLDPQFQWIIAGDFNMIKDLRDQCGRPSSLISGSEKRAWNHLRRRLHLYDTFIQHPGHLAFSWDNQHLYRHTPTAQTIHLGCHTLRRLDRIYSLDPSRNHLFNISSTILPGFSLSDHAPILATITFVEIPTAACNIV